MTFTDMSSWRWLLLALVLGMLGLCALLLWGFRKLHIQLGDVVAISAGLFFIYQAAAGAFFATTSVSLEGARCADNKKRILVKVTVERGDNWIAQIQRDEYTMERVIDQKTSWHPIGLPRRIDGILRLGPKEKTMTTFFVDADDEVAITARVTSFAVMWPFAQSDSYAKITVPK